MHRCRNRFGGGGGGLVLQFFFCKGRYNLGIENWGRKLFVGSGASPFFSLCCVYVLVHFVCLHIHPDGDADTVMICVDNVDVDKVSTI